MLKLKRKFHIPHFDLGTGRPLQLAPVPADDGDELTGAIYADPIDHDDNWQLDERPDQVELESFWNDVTRDLKKDPTWTDFAKEDA